MRVLFVIPHYIGPPSDPRVPITQSNVWPVGRLLAIHSTLSTLHRNFGQYRHHCRSTAVPEETEAHGVEHFHVVVLTQHEHHALDHLPLNPTLYETRFVDGPPLHIAFEAKRVFQERSEGYDFFVYLEDDIQIHDREFFRKLAWFQNEFGPAALLQPVRVEMSGRGLPVKAVIDCDLPPVSLAPFRREGQVTQLAATWNGLTRRFALPGNPHAAFHAVSAEQLRLWMDHRTFATDDTQWIGPMESAATAALAPVFDIYNTNPRSA